MVIELVFYNFLPYEKTGGYKNIHPRKFQKSRKVLLFQRLTSTHCEAKTNTEATQMKPPTIFHNFSIYYRTYTTKIIIFLQIHIGLSQQQHYPDSTIFENTRRISQDNPLSHNMIINYPRNAYPHTTKAILDHEDDGIMETILQQH